MAQRASRLFLLEEATTRCITGLSIKSSRFVTQESEEIVKAILDLSGEVTSRWSSAFFSSYFLILQIFIAVAELFLYSSSLFFFRCLGRIPRLAVEDLARNLHFADQIVRWQSKANADVQSGDSRVHDGSRL